MNWHSVCTSCAPAACLHQDRVVRLQFIVSRCREVEHTCKSYLPNNRCHLYCEPQRRQRLARLWWQRPKRWACQVAHIAISDDKHALLFHLQEFSADMNSRPVKRIADVSELRARQFPEDAGAMAHPIRPFSYIKMDNFYTSTVYEKGAEIVRLYQTLLGKDGFRYFLASAQ